MALAEIVMLSTMGIMVTFVWISLIRASVRGGCRSGSCRSATPRDNDKNDD